MSKENGNFSLGSKLLETFVVSFLATICGVLGTWIVKDNILLTALFSALGGIAGVLICEYAPKLSKLRSNSTEVTSTNTIPANNSFIPLVATILILLISILLIICNTTLGLNIIPRTSENPMFFMWFITLNVCSSISAMVMDSIREIREYGFEKSFSQILEFCLTRIFFTFLLGTIVLTGSLICTFIILVIFTILMYLGFNFFSPGDNMLDNGVLISVYVTVQIFFVHNMNKAMFDK